MSPETRGISQIEGESSLNLAASSFLGSSTGHCSPENPEAEACVFATGCFPLTETSFGISEAYSGVTTLAFNIIIISFFQNNYMYML